MAVEWRITAAAAEDMAEALLTLLDAHGDPAVIKIYKGSQPAGPATAATGTDLLVEIDCADPSFTNSGGVLTLDADPDLEANASASGTAAWARICSGAGAGDAAAIGIIDGNVGTSDAAINLNTVSITSGSPVRITSGTITVPTGAE